MYPDVARPIRMWPIQEAAEEVGILSKNEIMQFKEEGFFIVEQAQLLCEVATEVSVHEFQ